MRRVEVHEASHPLPDELSIAGAQKMLALAQTARPRDLVFLAITGGASALATLPPEGIRVAEIRALTDLSLKCGTTIREIDTVRRHLCLLKGGGLIAAVQPAQGITLTLDTAPEGLPWPDMCLADPSTFQDAIDVLHHTVSGRLRRIDRRYLREGLRLTERETLKSLDGMRASLFSVGDPTSACEAAAACARGPAPARDSLDVDRGRGAGYRCLSGRDRPRSRRGRPRSPLWLYPAVRPPSRWVAKKGWAGPIKDCLAFAQPFRAHRTRRVFRGRLGRYRWANRYRRRARRWRAIPRARTMEIDVVDALRRHRSSQALLDSVMRS